MPQLLLKPIKIFVLLGMGFSCSRGGADVLIRALKTDQTEFDSFVQVERIKPYAQARLEEFRKAPKPVNLSDLLKKSQEEFLSYTPKRAVKTYRRIVKHIHAFDWNEENRKIIFYSLLRLAQMEKTESKKTLLLKTAVGFALDLELDFNVFPPPLRTAYAAVKSSVVREEVNLKKIFPQHELIVVNGREYSSETKILLPKGFYRVSAFSSSYKEWTGVVSLKNLQEGLIQTKPLVQGECLRAKLAEGVSLKQKVKVLFPNFCVWSAEPAADQPEPLWEELKMPSNPPVKSGKHSFKAWVLIGGVALAAGLFIFIRNDASGVKQNQPAKDLRKTRNSKSGVRVGF